MKQFIACLVLAAAFASSEADLCVPGAVQNISLDANYTLQWSAPLNLNKCSLLYFVIDILDSENGIQRQLQTTNTIFSYNLVNMLDLCKQYTFDVRALTNESVFGPSSTIMTTTSPLPNINLSLNFLNATAKTDEIDLDWSLFDPEVRRCVSYYRVVYWDETNFPKDTYVYGNNFSLKENVPCMNYSFQVTAIIANPDIEGPVSEVFSTGHGKVPDVPSLVELSTTNTSVTMIWRLQKYQQNHCEVSSLDVRTLGAPAASLSLSFNVTDNIIRPDINVTIPLLKPNNIYVSSVSVKNSIGVSNNITATYQTSNSNFQLQQLW